MKKGAIVNYYAKIRKLIKYLLLVLHPEIETIQFWD